MQSIKTMLNGIMLAITGLFIMIFFTLYGNLDLQGLVGAVFLFTGIIVYLVGLYKKAE